MEIDIVKSELIFYLKFKIIYAKDEYVYADSIKMLIIVIVASSKIKV